jgi:hypothetical protein
MITGGQYPTFTVLRRPIAAANHLLDIEPPCHVGRVSVEVLRMEAVLAPEPGGPTEPPTDPVQPGVWDRYDDGEDVWFVNSTTQETVWELPEGAVLADPAAPEDPKQGPTLHDDLQALTADDTSAMPVELLDALVGLVNADDQVSPVCCRRCPNSPHLALRAANLCAGAGRGAPAVRRRRAPRAPVRRISPCEG